MEIWSCCATPTSRKRSRIQPSVDEVLDRSDQEETHYDTQVHIYYIKYSVPVHEI